MGDEGIGPPEENEAGVGDPFRIHADPVVAEGEPGADAAGAHADREVDL